MSANIYDEPNFAQKVRYGPRPRAGQGQGREREERVVEIYEGVDNGGLRTHRKVSPGPQIQAGSDCFKVLSAALGLLCLILLIIIGLLSYYYAVCCSSDVLNSKTQPKPPGLCPDAWQRVKCSCFFVSSARRNWTRSREDCVSRGADLAVIDGTEKQGTVDGLRPNEDLWIGLSYSNKKWSWVNNSASGYLSWAKGVKWSDTNNNIPEGSAAYVIEGGLWNHSLHGLRRWVCELKI